MTPTVYPTFVPIQENVEVFGEPAGCLSSAVERAVLTAQESLAEADRLVDLAIPLSDRVTQDSWNAYTRSNLSYQAGAFSLKVADVKNKYLVQKVMNALHVAGFITWLRDGPRQGQHILVIPLRGVDPVTS
ncbi:MAG: hypothetical protein EHM21_00760, partial [Chloroflexi bacterium]